MDVTTPVVEATVESAVSDEVVERTEPTSRPSRERKQVQRLEVVEEKKEKVIEFAQGHGIALSDYPFFISNFEKVKGDDDICKNLHLLMYGKLLPSKFYALLFFYGFALNKNV